jgi:hypothetical protein
MSEMTPTELRLAIAKAKGIPIATARTHDFKHGYGPERIVNAVTGKSVPDWPADIAAAWELVEEGEFIIGPEYAGGYDMRQIGWSVYECWVCAADDVNSENGHGRELAIAETAAIAICRAWLAWKGLDNAS